MEFLFDCANISTIRNYVEIYPITGVTSNPSIIKTEGKIDFFNHFKKIRETIGYEKSLHIQVIAEKCEDILREADIILNNIDDKVFIKIPTNEEGLKAMRILKSKGIRVTATAIYSKIQGFVAIASNVDFIAPYYNRMENLGVDSCNVISSFRKMINENNAKTKILAASFKNISQVTSALEAGAQAVTLQPAIIHEAFCMPVIQKAIDDFHTDWVNSQKTDSLI